MVVCMKVTMKTHYKRFLQINVSVEEAGIKKLATCLQWNCGHLYDTNKAGNVRFQVLTVAIIKIRAFWEIAPCSLGVDRRFRGAYCLHARTVEIMMNTRYI
jgi:hypothetical protein